MRRSAPLRDTARTARRAAATLVTLIAGALLACATTTTVPTPTAHGGEEGARAGLEAAAAALRPIDAWPEDVSLRQRVAIRWGEAGDEVARFEAVLEKRAGSLLLVGLGPMSRPGFVIRATDTGVELTNRTGRALPFDPAHVLADVQRVFYPWDPATPPTGLVVEERRGSEGEPGRLLERSFRRKGEVDGPAIRVDFGPDWYEAPRVPVSARVENGWFGYTLSVETFAATRLVPDPTTTTP